MNKDWPQTINEMQQKFGTHESVAKMSPALLKEFLKFRISCLQEEMIEIEHALENKDPEEIIDGIIDWCVFGIGTLDCYGVDAHKAWTAVLNANLAKNVGVKADRPNPFGLPDLIKPEGWQPPSHAGNHGKLTEALQ